MEFPQKVKILRKFATIFVKVILGNFVILVVQKVGPLKSKIFIR